MKIVCSKQNLVNGVSIVSKAVPNNTTMNILECILINASKDSITLTANDMDLGIETMIEGETIIEGSIAIEAKMLSDVVRKLPDDDITIETNIDFETTISCGELVFRISSKPGDDFTGIPSIEKNDTISVSMLTLKDIISKTIFSIGSGDVNRIMAGAHLIIKNDQMRITTLDGHRISIRKVQLKNIYPEKDVIVPGKALSEISKIIPFDADKDVSISLTNTHALFEFDTTVVVSRLIDGNYISVDKMMSSDYETKVTVSKKNLFDCVDRSLLFSKEGNKKPIVIEINDTMMNLSVKSSLGSMNEKIDVKKQGKDIRIGFNPKFILDVLKVMDEEEIDMYFVNSKAPLYIKDASESYVYMVLPVNLS